MAIMKNSHLLLGALAVSAAMVGTGCGSSTDETPAASAGGSAGAGGGSAGKAGAAGKGGASAGSGGATGGTTGKGGSSGTGATGGGGTTGKGGAAQGGAGQGGGGATGKGGAGQGGGGATGGKGGAGQGGGGAGGMGGKAGNGGGGMAGKGGAGQGGGGAGGMGGKAGNGGVGGSTGGPVASLQTVKADFGNVDCGGAAPANQTVTIKNTGKSDLNVSGAVSGSAAFAIVGANMIKVAPGQTGTFTVSAAAVPASATAGAVTQGTLTLTTNDPANMSIKVPLTETPQGATLVWVTPASGAFDFGQASIGMPATSGPLSLKNSGNVPVTVTFDASPDPQFSVAPASGSIAPAATLAGLAASFTASGPGAQSATETFKTSGAAICGTSASSLALKGTGIEGSIAVSGDIDFGANPCGGVAATPGKITITNSGAGAFTFTASNTNAGAYTLSATSGTVPGNSSLDITVTPAAIPFPSPVPGNYDDVVTITTMGIPGDTPHTVNLHQKADGAIVGFDKAGITFSGVSVGSNQNAGFNVTNTGSQNADVTLTETGSANFGVAPTTAITVAPNAPQSATASFAPTDNTPQSGNVVASVSAGTVLCQPLPAPLTLSGTGLNGSVGLDTATVDFGLVPCGGAAPTSKVVNITNLGNATYTWAMVLQGANTSQFAISCAVPAGQPTTVCPVGPVSGSLDPGQSANIVVDSLAASATGGISQLTAEIDITTSVINDTPSPHKVTITETPQGAILAWGPGLDFGNVPITKTSPPQDAVLTNSGNIPAAVTYGIVPPSQPFAVQASGTAAVGDTNVPVTFSPTMVTNYSAGVSVSTSTPVCKALPANVSVKGAGTKGAFKSGGNLAFGNVNCGTTPPARVIQLFNCGAADYNITVALTSGANYTFTTSGLVVPANTCGSPGATITVASNGVPQVSAVPGNYGDTLVVTTDIPGDNPHPFAVTETAQGAILTMSPTNLAFANTQTGNEGDFQFLLKNSGNVVAHVSYALGNGLPWFSIDSIDVPKNTQLVDTARFFPTNAQPYSDTASLIVTNTVLCQPLPAATQNGGIALSGLGTAPSGAQYAVNPSSLTFGATPISGSGSSVGVLCGTPANQTQNVTITNSTASATVFTASATGGYTVAASGAVPKGNSQLTITAPAVSAAALPGQVLNGTLTVTINGNTYMVALSTTVAGALLQFQDPSGGQIASVVSHATGCGGFFANCDATASGDFKIANSGNASVQYTLSQISGDINGYTWFPDTPGNPAGGTLISTVGGAAESDNATDTNHNAIDTVIGIKVASGTVCGTLPQLQVKQNN